MNKKQLKDIAHGKTPLPAWLYLQRAASGTLLMIVRNSRGAAGLTICEISPTHREAAALAIHDHQLDCAEPSMYDDDQVRGSAKRAITATRDDALAGFGDLRHRRAAWVRTALREYGEEHGMPKSAIEKAVQS